MIANSTQFVKRNFLCQGVELPFPWVRIVGNRVLISGHGPTNADGSLATPLGKVGAEVKVGQGEGATAPGSASRPD